MCHHIKIISSKDKRVLLLLGSCFFLQPSWLSLLSSGALSASADLLLLEQHLGLWSLSLHDMLLSEVCQHVCLHLLPGVCQHASLWAHHASTEVQLLHAKKRLGYLCLWLAVGLPGLSALPSDEDHQQWPELWLQREKHLQVFLRAAHEDYQWSSSWGPPDHSRTAGLHHPPHPGVSLHLSDCREPSWADSGADPWPRGEAEGVKDGAELCCGLPRVLCSLPCHYAPGLPG